MSALTTGVRRDAGGPLSPCKRCPHVNCRPSILGVVIFPGQHPLPVREHLRPKPAKFLAHICVLYDRRPWLTPSGEIAPEWISDYTVAEAEAVGWGGEA